MSVTPSYRSYVLEQLAGLGPVRFRRMFGAVGLYCDDVFFGLISSDTLYLKVDDANRPAYLQRGMSPFRPFRDRPQLEMGYYEVPADVLEDTEQLVAWARQSVRAAVSAPPKQAVSKRARRKRNART